MNDLEFHHIGVACDNLDDFIEEYQNLGYEVVSEIFTDPLQRIRGVFLKNHGNQIELLEPIDENSPISPFLKRGISMYHQGFLCDDIEKSKNRMLEMGCILISPLKKAIAFNNKRVCFLISPNKVITELIEKY